jgi:signal transduction histidine kinase
VHADVDRMGQVFANLLNNALRHTPGGGTVRFFGERDDGSVSVSVTDTGEGIAPEDLPRVFDRFFRSAAARASAGGSGIGLTIARAITRAHGGDLTADSGGPGAGASFRVTVPRRG